jgi:subtilisin family serine protease
MQSNIDTDTKINIDNKLGNLVINNVSSPVVYSGNKYGLDKSLKGQGVKIAILDSGCPKHKDIIIRGTKESFCETEKNTEDKMGHATLVSGIIGARNIKAVTGIASNSVLHFAKVIDQNGSCSFNSLIAAVLWSIAKEVDIIMMSLGTQYEYSILNDAIQKANEEGICIFAASGNNIKNNSNEIDFPARCAEVYSVGSLSRSDKVNRIISSKVDFALKNNMILTTYLRNKYIRTSGSSVLTALVTGTAALIVEKHKKSVKKKDMKEVVYKELLKIF